MLPRYGTRCFHDASEALLPPVLPPFYFRLLYSSLCR